eukprot:295913-Prorocentrum_lima.AAC.1
MACLGACRCHCADGGGGGCGTWQSTLGLAEPGVMPLDTSQLPGWPVEVVVQLVLEAELDHHVDIDVL